MDEAQELIVAASQALNASGFTAAARRRMSNQESATSCHQDTSSLNIDFFLMYLSWCTNITDAEIKSDCYEQMIHTFGLSKPGDSSRALVELVSVPRHIMITRARRNTVLPRGTNVAFCAG